LPETTVVVTQSLSYSGTTWINTVLGCHEEVFALTSADRALDPLNDPRILQYGEDNWDRICNVHYNECDFWPAFYRDYDRAGNFFHQLAERTGKNIIIINNPVPSVTGSHLNAPGVNCVYVNWIRDLRAVGASYWRKNLAKSFQEVLDEFLIPASQWRPPAPPNSQSVTVKYEDAVIEPLEAINKIGKLYGLEYEESALRYWEFEHHITGGNPSVYQLIRYAQGLEVLGWTDREYYLEEFDKIIANPGGVLKDNRWRENLSENDLSLFETHCGESNRHFGYEAG
jgi:hypothetical protein